MKIYSYIITRDYGFAPNPFYNCCTLATCKPRIRSSASVGDIIFGIGSAEQGSPYKNRIIYAMEVDEILTFDEYWNDARFQAKKPDMNGSKKVMYGDNIYHTSPETNKIVQEYSHHSHSDGSTNPYNYDRDVPGKRVLISYKYWYWGSNAIEIPKKFSRLADVAIGHRSWSDEPFVTEVRDWLYVLPEFGLLGFPCNFSRGFEHYNGR